MWKFFLSFLSVNNLQMSPTITLFYCYTQSAFELRDDNFSSLFQNIQKEIGKNRDGVISLLSLFARKAQVDLTEAYERADLTEQACAKYRSRGRSQSMARDY